MGSISIEPHESFRLLTIKFGPIVENQPPRERIDPVRWKVPTWAGLPLPHTHTPAAEDTDTKGMQFDLSAPGNSRLIYETQMPPPPCSTSEQSPVSYFSKIEFATCRRSRAVDSACAGGGGRRRVLASCTNL